ncbi:MAG: nuclear transport factor 2 family protein [Deltaproteobacteria bacterium]|nr:nuclear transport factor 2 family protein [Deltaproteobacteria bacterium]
MPLTGTSEDREQIRELYARYAFTIDHGPYEDWVKCFADDGVFDSPSLGRHEGSNALRKFTVTYKNAAGDSQVRHMMCNVTFRIEGDRAMGGCYLTYYHCKGGKATLEAIGRYQDELRKVNGEWLFQYRRVYVDGHG